MGESELHGDSAIRRHGRHLALSYNRWVEVFLRSLWGLVQLSHLYPLLCRLVSKHHETQMHTQSPHMHNAPSKQPCLFEFLDHLSALSFPWSPVLLNASGCCFVLFVNPACLFLQASTLPCHPPPLLLAHMLYLFPFVLLWGLSGGRRKNCFIKISMQTRFTHTLRHRINLHRQKGRRDEGGQSINLIKRFRKWRV